MVTRKQDKKSMLLEKIISLADEHHEGDVVGNMRMIFDKLSVYEKSIILNDWASFNFETKAVSIDDKKVDEEVDDIERFNKQEMIKLKVWMAKFITTSVLILAGAFFILSTTAEKATQGIESMFKILSVMLK
jgi:hypothetical protein